MRQLPGAREESGVLKMRQLPGAREVPGLWKVRGAPEARRMLREQEARKAFLTRSWNGRSLSIMNLWKYHQPIYVNSLAARQWVSTGKSRNRPGKQPFLPYPYRRR